MDVAWITGALGAAGVIATYTAGWVNNRKTEQRFATRDAIATLNDLLTQANDKIKQLSADMVLLKDERDSLHREVNGLRQENFDLRLRVNELEKTGHAT